MTEEIREFQKVSQEVERVLEPYNLLMREAIGAALYFDAVIKKALEEAGPNGFDDIEPVKKYILSHFETFINAAFPQ